MRKKAKYIIFEGTEGVGKSSQCDLLVEILRKKGYKVLQTKEPGTDHVPLTMRLRRIMLDNKYANEMTVEARELISQAIRSVHYEKLIKKEMNEYDYIIQDRGVLSGYCYGEACGNSRKDMKMLNKYIMKEESDMYDFIIYLRADTSKSLERAKTAKQEFETGDAMESKGEKFLNEVGALFEKYLTDYPHKIIDVKIKEDAKEGIKETSTLILDALKKKKLL